MKKRLLSSMLFCIILLSTFMAINVIRVEAAVKSIQSECKFRLDGYDDWDTIREKEFCFKTNKKMAFLVDIDVHVIDYVSKGGVRIQLYNSANKKIQDDYISLKEFSDEDYSAWFYNDGLLVPAGNYRYVIKSTANSDLTVKMSILGYDKLAKAVSVKKSISVKSGYWKKAGKIAKGNLPLIKGLYFSNEKIIDNWYVDVKGNIWICGAKTGSGTITTKLLNGKKYKTKLSVTAGDPNLFAELWGYNTRDNYFEVKVQNNGYSPVTILRNGKKVIERNYKTFDRALKSGSSVTINPGKTKYVRFYVKGSTTWYDYKDFTLYAAFKYQGKSYEWHVWDDDTVYKKGSKWYGTYWSNHESRYNEWK